MSFSVPYKKRKKKVQRTGKEKGRRKENGRRKEKKT
jgi:hypothetical protein